MVFVDRLLKRAGLQRVSKGDQRDKGSSRPEPDYVVTSRSDGRKSVDLSKFMQDERIKRQILELSQDESDLGLKKS